MSRYDKYSQTTGRLLVVELLGAAEFMQIIYQPRKRGISLRTLQLPLAQTRKMFADTNIRRDWRLLPFGSPHLATDRAHCANSEKRFPRAQSRRGLNAAKHAALLPRTFEKSLFPGAELYANAARRLYNINRTLNLAHFPRLCADERLRFRKFLPSCERWTQFEAERAIRADRFARSARSATTTDKRIGRVHYSRVDAPDVRNAWRSRLGSRSIAPRASCIIGRETLRGLLACVTTHPNYSSTLASGS